MTITEIQIMPIKPKDGLVAIASFIYGRIYMGSIGVYSKIGGTGYRLTYPTKTVGGREMNIFHPIDRHTSRLIEEVVIKKVEEIFG